MKALSLDGGGLFGVGQAAILSKVSNLSKFEIIAGTSVGSIVGAMVATGYPQSKYVETFKTLGNTVFKDYCWRRFNPITPRYNDAKLNDVLRGMFSIPFKSVGIPMLITAVDLDNRNLKVYSSMDKQDGQIMLWEIIRQAVAAETYFLPWKGMADGGIMANNPCMVAVAGIVDEFNIDVEDIELLSIGTGDKNHSEGIGSTKGWTVMGWGMYILESALDGAANQMHSFFVNQLDLRKFDRIQFSRPRGYAMDNPRTVDVCLDEWAPMITSGIATVDAF